MRKEKQETVPVLSPLYNRQRTVIYTRSFNVRSSCYGNTELPYGSPKFSFSTLCCHSPENMPANVCTTIYKEKKSLCFSHTVPPEGAILLKTILLVIQNGKYIHFHLSHGHEKFNQTSNKLGNHSYVRTVTHLLTIFLYGRYHPMVCLQPWQMSFSKLHMITYRHNLF